VPLDGIGFQAHVHGQADEVNTHTLIKHLKLLADMGLLARISEADVYGDSQSKQSEQYANILQACLGSSNCTAFTTWGVTDRYGSTTELHNYPLQTGNDLIWDASLKPKATYRNLQTILSKR